MKLFVKGQEINMDAYKAFYLNSSYQQSDMKPKVFWPSKALAPLYYGSETGFDSLTVQILFKDAEHEDIALFSELLASCRMVFDSGFLKGKEAECILKKSKLVKVSRNRKTAEYEFQALIYGEQQEFQLIAGTNEVEIHGAKETEAVLTIRNNGTKSIEVSLMGITIPSLAAGEEVIIDGIKKTIMTEGVSVFRKVDMVTFPRVKPGTETIMLTGDAEVMLSYRERW